MTIVNDFLDGGWPTTSNIEIEPLNSGISDFTLHSTSGVAGGIPLIRTTDGTPFIAYEEVAAAPIPAAVWLFASGLLGLVSVARGKKA
jgi:hypothetical protein